MQQLRMLKPNNLPMFYLSMMFLVVLAVAMFSLVDTLNNTQEGEETEAQLTYINNIGILILCITFGFGFCLGLSI